MALCSTAGASGRQAWLGSSYGACSPLGLQPLRRNGMPKLPYQNKLCRAPQALPEGETMRTVVEGLGNIQASHVHLADITNHLVNTLFSLADDSTVVDTVSSTADTLSSAADTMSSAADTISDVVSSAASAVADPATSVATDPAAVDAAATAAKDSGWFGFLADAFEGILRIIDGGLEAANVPYSYGFSIILLTIFVKILTFPLSKQQVESSVAMQQLQPRVQEIQAKYKNNPERLQQETAALYQEAGVNPLAGCLPTLATIPVFIGLYKSLTQAADEGLLNESWFFIPSLAGPTSMSARDAGAGTSWLFPFENGAPPVGWHDAGAYLILPALLIISQVISQKIISPPKSSDPSQQQMQGFLSFLPFLLGWFSLNVPSGLTLYWITNNILSTGQQAYLKSTAKPPELKPMGTVVKPKAEPVVTPTGAQMGSRRSQVIDVDDYEVIPESKPSQGEKFRARRARDAAQRAAKKATAGESMPPPANVEFTPPPDLAAEITPITENLERDIEEDSDSTENGTKSSSNGSDKVKANISPAQGAEVAAVGVKGKKRGGKRGKKGRKGRKKQ